MYTYTIVVILVLSISLGERTLNYADVLFRNPADTILIDAQALLLLLISLFLFLMWLLSTSQGGAKEKTDPELDALDLSSLATTDTSSGLKILPSL